MELKYLPFILLLPFVLAAIAKSIFHATISNKEMTIQVGLGIVFSVIVFYIAVYSANYDTYYIHGEITSKSKDRVTCSHTYQTCVTSGKTRVCTTHRRHSYDNEYWIHSTIGSTEIMPLDSQGLITPDRWQIAQVGEHYTDTASFQNYLANSDYSIMNKKYENVTDDAITERPEIYDVYRFDPVTSWGVPINVNEYNGVLKEKLKTKGYAYNLNILFTTHEPEDFKYRVIKKWRPVLNDILVIVNVEEGKVTWAEAVMYADNIRNESLSTDVRHDLVGRSLDTTLVTDLVKMADAKYYKPGEAEFERLKFEMELSVWQWIAIFTFNLVFNIAVSVYMHKNEL